MGRVRGCDVHECVHREALRTHVRQHSAQRQLAPIVHPVHLDVVSGVVTAEAHDQGHVVHHGGGQLQLQGTVPRDEREVDARQGGGGRGPRATGKPGAIASDACVPLGSV